MNSRVSSILKPKVKPTTTRVLSAFVLFTLTAISSGNMSAVAQKNSPVRPRKARTTQTLSKITEVTPNQESNTTQATPEINSESTPTDSEADVEKPQTDLCEIKPFVATAYCLKSRTASGELPQPGAIAADLKVLPMGSVVKIHAGQYSGVYRVVDTGKKVRGNKIDIYMPSKTECLQFGRRNIRVEVLKKGYRRK